MHDVFTTCLSLPSTVMFRRKCHVVINGFLQFSSKFGGYHIRHNLAIIHEVRIAKVHLYRHVMFQGLDEAMNPKRSSETSRNAILLEDVQDLSISEQVSQDHGKGIDRC